MLDVPSMTAILSQILFQASILVAGIGIVTLLRPRRA
jgi:hypothetical protein